VKESLAEKRAIFQFRKLCADHIRIQQSIFQALSRRAVILIYSRSVETCFALGSFSYISSFHISQVQCFVSTNSLGTSQSENSPARVEENLSTAGVKNDGFPVFRGSFPTRPIEFILDLKKSVKTVWSRIGRPRGSLNRVTHDVENTFLR